MTYKVISAEPGNPSTFWQGASGRWYRSREDAKKDNVAKAVNPDDYIYYRSFWAHNKKTIIWCLVFVILILAFVYLYKAGYLVLHVHNKNKKSVSNNTAEPSVGTQTVE